MDRPRSPWLRPQLASLLFNQQHDASFSTSFLHNGSQYVDYILYLGGLVANHWQRERSGSKCDSAELGTRLASTPRNHNIDTDLYRTRKAKEVNFGFSFGSPLAEPSAPVPLAIVPEPRNPPQTQTAPVTTPPLKASRPISQGPRTERTPGSARNKLPERPSTYDIPSDDRSEQTQSNKRRKLSTLWSRPILFAESMS